MSLKLLRVFNVVKKDIYSELSFKKEENHCILSIQYEPNIIYIYICLIFKPILKGKDQYRHFTDEKLQFRKVKTLIQVSSRDDANVISSKPKQTNKSLQCLQNNSIPAPHQLVILLQLELTLPTKFLSQIFTSLKTKSWICIFTHYLIISLLFWGLLSSISDLLLFFSFKPILSCSLSFLYAAQM